MFLLTNKNNTKKKQNLKFFQKPPQEDSDSAWSKHFARCPDWVYPQPSKMSKKRTHSNVMETKEEEVQPGATETTSHIGHKLAGRIPQFTPYVAENCSQRVCVSQQHLNIWISTNNSHHLYLLMHNYNKLHFST